MRGLTAEEAAALRGERCRLWRNGEPGRDEALAMAEGLRLQGRCSRTVESDGTIRYAVTDLGRLALRVHELVAQVSQ